ncbi:MAG: complex I NDUFA9 subunit family protein [Parvularculaceae bacterium]
MNKLAVVFGGSGFVGRNVVRELAARGWRVRVAVRRPHLANYLKPLGAVGQIQLFQSNIRYRPSVAEALVGADAVVNLVGILAKQGAQTFDAVHALGARNIAAMSAKAGISDIVHVSAIGADLDSASNYARTKALGEAAFRDAVPETTIMRPSIIFGPRDGFFNRFAGMAQLLPALPLLGGGHTRMQPVYVDDVADAVCVALETPEAAGQTYELGGPQAYSFKELMQKMLAVTGRKRVLVPLPWFAAGMMGVAGDIANWVPFVKAPITSDQVRLLKVDNVVGEGVGTLADLGLKPTPMESVLPSYLARFRKYGQFSPDSGG